MSAGNIVESATNTVLIQDIKVRVYTIPTDLPEADGTLEWDSTTMVLVEVEAGGMKGIGYTYGHAAIAQVINATLKPLVIGKDIMQLAAITTAMANAIRNNGTCGIGMMAVSAVDIALWDLKARIFDVPLVHLLGMQKSEMLLYGSGGFTFYTDTELQNQFGDWVANGIRYVKMKVGAHPEADVERVKTARNAIGKNTGLFVDANGAYTIRQAIDMASHFAALNVTWFEEPVRSDDLKGLNLLRKKVPAAMQIAAGEYGYNLPYFNAMLDAGAVDVLQGDATRCGGISGFLKAGNLCEAFQLPFSSHCAPAIHLHAALALPAFYIAEYFHDHVRIERMFFDGLPAPVDGVLKPDLSRPGNGLVLKEADIINYQV